VRKKDYIRLTVFLPIDQDKALRAIVDAPQAWCPVRKLERAGHSAATLEALHGLGWVAPWTHDRRRKPLSYPSWAVTPWGAKQLGLRLIEWHGLPVWSTAVNGTPEESIARPGRGQSRLCFPELVADQARTRKRSPRYVGSYYWGETTEDPEEAERILGVPVELVEAL
jgi:hypothetical protein